MLTAGKGLLANGWWITPLMAPNFLQQFVSARKKRYRH